VSRPRPAHFVFPTHPTSNLRQLGIYKREREREKGLSDLRDCAPCGSTYIYTIVEFRRVQLPRTGLERIWTLSVSSLGFTHFTPEARTHDAVYLGPKIRVLMNAIKWGKPSRIAPTGELGFSFVFCTEQNY
jgi:hypothetical protein